MIQCSIFGEFMSAFNFSLFYADSLRFSCKLNLHRFLLHSPLNGMITITGAAFFHYHPLDSSPGGLRASNRAEFWAGEVKTPGSVDTPRSF